MLYKTQFFKQIFISTLLIGTFLNIFTFGEKPRNNPQKYGYKIEMFKVQCTNFTSDLVRLETCKILAKRGTGGLLNLVIHYKGVTDIKTKLKFLYRGTSGHYQPFLIDVIMNPCDMLRYKSENIMLQRSLTVIEEFDKTLRTGCPLKGPYNMSNFDINKLIGNVYPPVAAGEIL